MTDRVIRGRQYKPITATKLCPRCGSEIPDERFVAEPES